MADTLGANSPSENTILLEEYKLHRAELQMRFTHSISLIGFTIGGLLAFFGLAVKEKLTLLVILTPWLSGILIGYFAGHCMVMSLSVAYLRDLEKRLGVLDYERCVTNEKWFKTPFLKNPFQMVGATLVIPCIAVYTGFLYEVWRFARPQYTCAAAVFLIVVVAPTIFNVGLAILSAWGAKYASKLPSERLYKK